MHRLTLLVLCSMLAAAGIASAQEEEVQADAAPDETVAEEASPDDGEDASEDDVTEDEEFDDSDLDLQTYEEDEDDFVPTEEIPADQAIPFPSDI